MCTWNSDGFVRFVKNEELVSYLCKYDLICISETWATSDINIDSCFDGFICEKVAAVGYKSHGRPSCGVAVFYKQHLRGYFNRIFKDFQFGVVFELPGQMFGCIKSVI